MDKLRIKQLLLTILSVISIIGVYLYYFYPTPIMKAFNYINASLAKLEKKSITIDGYIVNYYEGVVPAEKDILILLHGLGDDKNSFVRSAKSLNDQYHVILPDLLGHGENEKKPGLDYSIEGQVKIMKKFVQAKNIKRFHFGGNSMGGHIALAYATHYQDTLKSLIIINAPGLKIDDHIPYNGFEDKTISEEEFDSIMAKAFYKLPKLPRPLRICKINQINESHDFIKYILIPQVMNNRDFDLLNKVSNIHVPTLILWGKHDEIVKYNIAEKYDQLIPNSKLIVINNASHCPQLELPDTIAAEIDTFIKGTRRTDGGGTIF